MLKKNGHANPARLKFLQEMLGCASSLKAFALSISGNVDRAEDLIQETFIRAMANIHSFEPGTNMEAWLFTILRNHFRSEYRKRRREVEDPDGYYAGSLTTHPDQEDAVGFEQMLEYLACLPTEQSDALVAIGYLGMSYEEAAERLNCAVGTVKSRVNRARVLLAELMESAVVDKFDIFRLKFATQGIPKSHSYYPIAAAYEELYAGSIMEPKNLPEEIKSSSEQAWKKLVASGALDQPADDVPSFIQE